MRRKYSIYLKKKEKIRVVNLTDFFEVSLLIYWNRRTVAPTTKDVT